MSSKSNLAIGFLTVKSIFICEAHGRAGYVDVYQAAIGSGNQPCGRTLTRIEQAHYSSIVDSRLYAVDSQDASHIAISALPEALDEADSFLKLHVTDGREDKDTSIGCVLVVRNDDTLGVSRSSSLKDVDKEKVSAPDVIRGVALRTYEDEGRAAYMLLPYNMFAKDNRYCQHLLRLLNILMGREPQLNPPPLSVSCAVSASEPDWLSVDEYTNTVKGFNDPDSVPRSRKSWDSGKDVDANTLRECVATAGGSIGPHTELGDLQVLHGDSLDDVNVADAAAAAAPDSKHVLYASLTDLNDSGGFPDLLLSVLQPSLGTQGPNQQLYQRLHQQHQGRPPAQPSRRPPPPPPQLLLIWAPVHSSASGQHPHLVSDEDGLVVQQLGEQEWRACKGRLEARGAVLGLAALRPLVGLHYSGAVYCAASVAALRGELARLGAALRRGGPAAAAGGGATQAKQGARTTGKQPAATVARERRRLDYDECGVCDACLGNSAGANGCGGACEFCGEKRRPAANQDKENVDPRPSTSQVPQKMEKPTGTSAEGKGQPSPLQDAQPRLQDPHPEDVQPCLQDTDTRANQGDCRADAKGQPARPPSSGGEGPHGEDNAPYGTSPDNNRQMALNALQAEKAALEQQAAATAAATAQLAAASRAARQTLPAAADGAMKALTQAIDEGRKQLAGAKEAAMQRLDQAYTDADEVVRAHVQVHVQGNPEGKERDVGPLTEAAKGALGALVAAGKEAVRQLEEEAAGVQRGFQGAAEGAVRQHAEARAGVRKLLADAKAVLLVDLPEGGGTGMHAALGQLAEDVEAAVEQQAARDADRVERQAAEGKAAVGGKAAEDLAELEGAVKACAAQLQSAYCSSLGVVLQRLREHTENVRRFADALWGDGARADGD